MQPGTKKYQTNKQGVPHTGHLLDRHLTDSGIPVTELAKAVKRNQATVNRYLARGSMQTGILWELCHALKHNFFADIAAELPATYSSKAITALQEELKKVTTERDLLKEMISK